VKQLVEAHGGRVGAESGDARPQGGTRVWLTLQAGTSQSVTGMALTPDPSAAEADT